MYLRFWQRAGDPLHEWAQRAPPDRRAALAVLLHVASNLAAVHAAGIVHNDLKPQNVLWLGSQQKWQLADFGLAAPIGTPAPLTQTLECAPARLVPVVHIIFK